MGKVINMVDFTEWQARKAHNKRIRADWAVVIAHVSQLQNAQDGYAAVKGGAVVWMGGDKLEGVAGGHVFAVRGGLVNIQEGELG